MPIPHAHDQQVASVVHIQIERSPEPVLTLSPDPVHAYYTHDGGRGDEMKPHGVLWEAFGLLHGERLEIEVSGIHGLVPPLVTARVLGVLFDPGLVEPGGVIPPDPVIPPPVPVVWTIPYGASSVESIPFTLPSDELGRIWLKYDVRLYADDVLIGEWDPGVHLIPDP